MTAPSPPPGVVAVRPPAGCHALWEHGQPGHAAIRIRPGRVELRTGPSGYGPDFTDPAELRRFAWRQLAALLAAATALEHGACEPEPDPQLSLDLIGATP